jgi:hypothetical protein
MPEFFEVLEIPHENIMGQILGIIRFRAIAPADQIDFPVVPVIDVFKMLLIDCPADRQIGMPNSVWAYWIHLVPFSGF